MTPQPPPPDGPIALIPAAAARVTDVVAAIPGDRWDAPSPCRRWSVRDVLNHLVSEHLWAPHLLRGETLAEVGDRYDGDVLGTDPLGAWTAAIAASLLAWADAEAAGPDAGHRNVHTSLGPIPLREYGHQMLVDLTVHGWDLATGGGTAYEPHPDAVRECLDYEQPRVGTAGVAGIFRPPVPTQSDRPFGALLALLGRNPG